jgi:glyoxylase-like metal-dependent hydrolase (beta-lactamase superfamily II)/rhodanese-related sulfurtransferase
MLLEQFYLNCLAHASYIVADEGTRRAVVVDPQRDIAQYLDYAADHGLSIEHVVLTHLHADFLAGHLELREATGATIHLGRQAQAEYAFSPLGTGDRIELGSVRLEALETPGHTPESISLLVFDDASGRTGPVAVLTGDTLFVGDVGRPDLRASLGWAASTLAEMLYDSLHDRLLRLPDEARVYPAHGAGSLCGKAISQETASTIGEQRRVNYALQPMTKDAFVGLITADQPDAPEYFTYDAVLNTRERPTLDATLARELRPLSVDEFLNARAAGAQVLDTRDPAFFAASHLTGSINIGLVGQYATWAGTLLAHDTPIVIIADPGMERDSALRLGRIGFDNVAGFLDGGLAALADRADLLASTDRLAPEVLADRMAGSKPPLVLDVRSAQERSEGTIDGALHIPLNQLPRRVHELPRDRPVVTHCAGGYRSSIAASLLQGAGIPASELAGGFAAWKNAQTSGDATGASGNPAAGDRPH